ncbi:MAG TPA: hypothetical protein P5342_03950, partial [Candidatus Cloacimonadota bacterium]|nr:hypothetical protein [Candidatus Cloacimonadota bacterium]
LRRLIQRKFPQIQISGVYDNILKCLAICLVLYIFATWLSASILLYGKIGLLFKSIIVVSLFLLFFYIAGVLLKLSYFREATQSICKRLLRK